MPLYTLVVKGNKEQARDTASRRFRDIMTEIRVVKTGDSDTTLTARLPAEAEAKLVRWFTEDVGRKPPYAAGSLIWYGARSGNGLGFGPAEHRSRGSGAVTIAVSAALSAKLELSRGSCRRALSYLLEASDIAGRAKAHGASAKASDIGVNAVRAKAIIEKLHKRALDRCVK